MIESHDGMEMEQLLKECKSPQKDSLGSSLDVDTFFCNNLTRHDTMSSMQSDHAMIIDWPVPFKNITPHNITPQNINPHTHIDPLSDPVTHCASTLQYSSSSSASASDSHSVISFLHDSDLELSESDRESLLPPSPSFPSKTLKRALKNKQQPLRAFSASPDSPASSSSLENNDSSSDSLGANNTKRKSKHHQQQHPTITKDPLVDDLLYIKEMVQVSIQEENARLEEGLKDPNLSLVEKRLLKNKMSAKQFRLRRKEYISTLEKEIRRIRLENTDLHKKTEFLENHVVDLTRQVYKLNGQTDTVVTIDDEFYARNGLSTTKDMVTIRIPPQMKADNLPKDMTDVVKQVTQRKLRMDKLISGFTAPRLPMMNTMPYHGMMPYPMPYYGAYPNMNMPYLPPPPTQKQQQKQPLQNDTIPSTQNTSMHKPSIQPQDNPTTKEITAANNVTAQSKTPKNHTPPTLCRSHTSATVQRPNEGYRVQVHTALVPQTYPDIHPLVKYLDFISINTSKKVHVESISDVKQKYVSQKELFVRFVVLLYLASKVVGTRKE